MPPRRPREGNELIDMNLRSVLKMQLMQHDLPSKEKKRVKWIAETVLNPGYPRASKEMMAIRCVLDAIHHVNPLTKKSAYMFKYDLLHDLLLEIMDDLDDLPALTPASDSD